MIMSCSKQIAEVIKMSQVTPSMSLHVWGLNQLLCEEEILHLLFKLEFLPALSFCQRVWGPLKLL